MNATIAGSTTKVDAIGAAAVAPATPATGRRTPATFPHEATVHPHSERCLQEQLEPDLQPRACSRHLGFDVPGTFVLDPGFTRRP